MSKIRARGEGQAGNEWHRSMSILDVNARTMNKRFSLFSATAIGLLLAAAAPAEDTVQGTRGPGDVVETDHSADILLRPGAARIVVRRTMHNRGERTDQAVLSIESPPGATAVRLRTSSLVGQQTAWFEGDLMDRDVAEERYQELTGVGMAIPKDPALLYWVGRARLGLQVFPIPAGETKTVEYTLVAPVSYQAGRYRLAMTAMGTHDRAATAHLRAEAARALFVDEERHAAGAAVSLDGGVEELSFERANAPRLDGAMAVVPVSARRSVLRFRFDAAAKLSTVPRRAAVAVVLDESRSIEEDDVRAGRALAAEYLSHFPDARVAIVPFDREARPLASSLSSSVEAVRLLGRLPLTRRNGSNIDAALARAASLLAQVPATVPKRLLVVTDSLTRGALSSGQLRRAFSATSALAHVAIAVAGTPQLALAEEHEWLDHVRPTGGLVWSAAMSEPTDDEERAMARSVFEELARPVRLHHLQLTGSGIDLRSIGELPFELPDALPEGEGIGEMRMVQGTPSRLVLSGELWATAIRKTLTPSAAEAPLAAALAFGDDLLWELSEAEQRVLAYRGRAVSPVTSYLAIEPGVRPSTDGLLESESGSGFGSLGVGLGGGGAAVRMGAGSSRSDEEIVAALRDRWGVCGGRGAARLDLETTYTEIVDVLNVSASLPQKPEVIPCWIEAAWAYELADFRPLERDVVHVVL